MTSERFFSIYVDNSRFERNLLKCREVSWCNNEISKVIKGWAQNYNLFKKIFANIIKIANKKVTSQIHVSILIYQ